MRLLATNYQKTKFEVARAKFPPGMPWTRTELALRIGISDLTAERWLLRWIAEGWVRKTETGEPRHTAGSAKYRYSFRAAPQPVMRFREAERVWGGETGER